LDGGQRRQFDMLLARARRLCRAVDVAWDGLARVMAAAQAWLSAAAMEAAAAGLIDHPAEACLLELEELKQVATGEWHRGRSARVRAEVMQRQVELNACAGERPRTPVAAAPGAARGPVVRLEALDSVLRLQGAIMVAQVADPGCAPYWLAAAAVVDGAGDPWTPGMIVARALAAPAVTGTPGAAMPGVPGAITDGQHVAVDGGSGRFEPVPA
jgi:phosphohistidine swiveling domain-containing protein